jgi:hypothetical protein
MAGSESASPRIRAGRVLFRSGDPWVLLSIATASFRGRCALRRLIAAADCINHAIVTRAEIEGGVNRLARAGLLSFSPMGFSLTPKARRLLLGLESKSRSPLKQWKMLEEYLPSLKPLTRRLARWRLSSVYYRQTVAEYMRSFGTRQ